MKKFTPELINTYVLNTTTIKQFKFLMTLTVISLRHKINTGVRKYKETNKQHSEFKRVDK